MKIFLVQEGCMFSLSSPGPTWQPYSQLLTRWFRNQAVLGLSSMRIFAFNRVAQVINLSVVAEAGVFESALSFTTNEKERIQ